MKFILTILLVIFYSELYAQIETDRPDQTEASSTVPKNALQIESGILVEISEDNFAESRNILLPTNLFRIGIFKPVELRFLSQFELNKYGNFNYSGISDLEIGTKIQIYRKENSKTEIAFLSHLIVPTGSQKVTRDLYGTTNKISISHQLGENFGLGYNIGYNYFGSGNGDLTYTMALGFQLSEKISVYVEPYGSYDDMENFVANFDAGFAYLINNNVQFDFSFGTGINNDMNYLSTGISFLLPNLSSGSK